MPSEPARRENIGTAVPQAPSYARWFAESWSGVSRGTHRAPGPGDGPTQRFGAAAEYAKARYPGRAGDLIRREILAYREFGFRFDGSGLIPRLVDDLLADRGQGRGGQ